jgi:hypothetical protein
MTANINENDAAYHFAQSLGVHKIDTMKILQLATAYLNIAA